MLPKRSNNIDTIYLSLLRRLSISPKCGNTREISNVQIMLDNIENNIVSIRNLSPSYLAGELLWYWGNRNDLDFISKFSSFWSHISDDGVTSNSAYGYLMQSGYGFNQIELIIEMLQKDSNSRRAVINLNVPNPNAIITKDEICTIAVQFYIRNGKLNCTTMMRSNDIWFGFPYDVAFFTDLQKYIAMRLNVKYGTYTHFVVSMHMYNKDYDKIQEIIKNPVSNKMYLNSIKFHAPGVIPDALKCVSESTNPKVDLVNYLTEREILQIENPCN